MRKRIYYECLDQSDAFVILGNCDQNLWRNLIRLFFYNFARGTRHEPIEMKPLHDRPEEFVQFLLAHHQFLNEAADPDDQLAQVAADNFQNNFEKILRGVSHKWSLIGVEIHPDASLVLRYQHAEFSQQTQAVRIEPSDRSYCFTLPPIKSGYTPTYIVQPHAGPSGQLRIIEDFGNICRFITFERQGSKLELRVEEFCGL